MAPTDVEIDALSVGRGCGSAVERGGAATGAALSPVQADIVTQLSATMAAIAVAATDVRRSERRGRTDNIPALHASVSPVLYRADYR